MSHTAPAVELSRTAHHLPAAGGVLLATGLLAGLPLALGDTGRAVAVAVLQLALVAAWVLATGIRGFIGSLAIGAAAAVGADLLLGLPEDPEPGALLLVLGPGFLVCVLHQMARPAPRRYLVASLAGVLLLLCAVTAPALLLALGRTPDGDRLASTAVLVVGAVLLVGHAVDYLLPRPAIAPGVPRGLPGLVLAVLAGVVVAVLRRQSEDLPGALAAALVGAALAGVAALVAVGASFGAVDRPQRGWALPAVQAVLPFAAAAPVAWFLALQTSL
ncbi:hypothetical protein [Klenkia taihuensis]|uniref:Uncharacterized protein n=1 Tax=Klenkia taihuensis TaxID=1225127 RepID=A0A1I1J140_9ACTN|nr:hypothetical protein [Klenkia taihuensis]GHE11154.1 hypothetical protein GCM10011381_23520 [Klenkia taihuensis]SFC42309.1 hypothetical protein SAMN05661030_0925 [Klenkia taihuensis]